MNITERKRVEEELRASREQLRALAARIETIRESERTGIAREIHDELGQALTSLKMDLTWVEQRLPHDAPGRSKVSPMLILIDHLIQTVQRISSDLRPGMLDDLGLVAAIEWQAEQFEARTGLRVVLVLPSEDIDMDRARATAAFRVFQEILTNIARHARAKRVEVRLQVTTKDLVLEVKDNGCGIAEQEITSPNSLGLLGIKERLIPFGGAASFVGAAGIGTAVTVRIPMRQG